MVRQVRNSYPPPPCLIRLEQVSMEEWLKITLDEVKKLYDSIHKRIEAVQKTGKGPTNMTYITVASHHMEHHTRHFYNAHTYFDKVYMHPVKAVCNRIAHQQFLQ